MTTNDQINIAGGLVQAIAMALGLFLLLCTILLPVFVLSIRNTLRRIEITLGEALVELRRRNASPPQALRPAPPRH